MFRLPSRIVEVDEGTTFQWRKTFDLLSQAAAGQKRVGGAGGSVPFSETAAGQSFAAAGDVVPDWCQPDAPVYSRPVSVFTATDVYYVPLLGAVIRADGSLFKASFEEARYFNPSYREIPGASLWTGAPRFRPPRRCREIDTACIWMPWGARHNYGHFVLDALTSLEALAQVVPPETPRISPPLKAWQEDHLRLLDRGVSTVIDDPIIRLRRAYWVSTMDHFLHAPTPLVTEVRDRQLGDRKGTASRIYLTRTRTATKRLMLNEAALIAALEGEGFSIVEPEALSIADQIALFASAETVVAPTGAALANVLYCRPGTRVVEIQPTGTPQIWVRNLAVQADLAWTPFFARSSPASTPVFIDGVERPELDISYSVDVAALMRFLGSPALPVRSDPEYAPMSERA